MCNINPIFITDKDEIKNRELVSRVNYLAERVTKLEEKQKQKRSDNYVN